MSKETHTILKSMLYNVKKAETLEEAVISLEAMCDEETIAYVEKKVKEAKEKLNKN
ncbi:MAG: hypothetical protein FWF50_02630 [Defluviitaleaceae bacterium]|nr:hypothetical protein [Defluviitaleaceae bacterium]